MLSARPMISGSWSDDRNAFGWYRPRRVELGVVVEDQRLVGVDVPDRRAGDVVERGRRLASAWSSSPGEAVEHEAVAIGVGDERLGEADVPGVLEGVDRVLFGVGVEVTDDQRVGRVERVEDLDERLRLSTRRWLKQLWPSPWSGRRAGALPAAQFLDLKWLTTTRDGLAAADPRERLDQRWPVEDRIGRGLRGADRGHGRRPVDQRDLDRVGAEGATELVRRVDRRFGDVGVGARRGRGVQGVDETADRRRAVVLDLHQAEDVGVDAEDRRDLLRLLASELGGVVGAAGVRVVVGERREVVERVEAGDLDVAADVGSGAAGRGFVRANAIGVRRLQAVEAEAEAQHAGDAARRCRRCGRLQG